MKKKLFLLNLALLALLLAGLAEFQRQIRLANDRYAILNGAGPAQSEPSHEEPGPRPRVRPADHLAAVERFLFSPDRNPIIEVEAPEDAAPVRRPHWPLLVGVMELGDGPIALMAPDSQTAAKPVQVGETVGEFLFQSAGADKITLEWQGESFEVLHEDLTGGEPDAPQARVVRRNRPSREPSLPPSPTTNVTAEDDRLGRELRPGVRAARPGDSSPSGTEHKGYVKRVRRTPFGVNAWWEKTSSAKDGKK